MLLSSRLSQSVSHWWSKRIARHRLATSDALNYSTSFLGPPCLYYLPLDACLPVAEFTNDSITVLWLK